MIGRQGSKMSPVSAGGSATPRGPVPALVRAAEVNLALVGRTGAKGLSALASHGNRSVRSGQMPAPLAASVTTGKRTGNGADVVVFGIAATKRD